VVSVARQIQVPGRSPRQVLDPGVERIGDRREDGHRAGGIDLVDDSGAVVRDVEIALRIEDQSPGGAESGGIGADRAIRSDPLDGRAAIVRDVEIAHRIEGERAGIIEAGREDGLGPIRGNPMDDPAAVVGDEEVPRAVEGQTVGGIRRGVEHRDDGLAGDLEHRRAHASSPVGHEEVLQFVEGESIRTVQAGAGQEGAHSRGYGRSRALGPGDPRSPEERQAYDSDLGDESRTTLVAFHSLAPSSWWGTVVRSRIRTCILVCCEPPTSHFCLLHVAS